MRKIIFWSSSVIVALLTVMLVSEMPARATQVFSLPLSSAKEPSSLFLDSTDRVLRDTTASSALSCREGLVGWEPYLSVGLDIQSLGSGVYLDVSAHAPAPQPAAMEFIQVLRIRQNKDSHGNYLSGYTVVPELSDAAQGLGPIIASAPGSLWLIGNEPDRGPDFPGGPAQDDTFPAVYARVYHDVYQFIKQRDPTAQVAIGGLVEITPGRLQYLDIMWNAYGTLYHEQMPVDVWNMHLYVLPEVTGIANVALGTDPALAYGFAFTHTAGDSNVYTYGDHDKLNLFDQQVRWMRQWMKQHGQVDKPLLISELGLLYDEDVTDEFGNNFTEPRAASFLTKTYNYLSNARDSNIGMPSDDNRLVQQWTWFSTYYSTVGHISNLVSNTIPITFTSVGNMFRASVATRPLRPNLQPRMVIASTPILSGESSVTATLSAQVINNGNQLVSVPLTVTFYSDAGLTQAIDSAVITSGVPGCARRLITASVVWPAQSAGFHPFWVKVDSSNMVDEVSEVDNVATGQVFVGTQQVLLPLIGKD